jgi:hypothetical protein
MTARKMAENRQKTHAVVVTCVGDLKIVGESISELQII